MDHLSVTVLIIAVAVAMGAFAQAVTGFGFSLLVAPVCALVLPGSWVPGTIARLAVVADVGVLASGWADVDRDAVRNMALPALAAVPIAVVLTRVVPVGALVVVGAGSTLAASAAVLAGQRAAVSRHGRRGAAAVGPSSGHRGELLRRAAGFSSGLLGITTGLSGPPVALHAVWTGRPAATTRGTLAAFFLLVDLVAVVAHRGALPGGQLGWLLLGIVGGIGVGRWARTRVDDRATRLAVVALVGAAAVVAISRSLW